MVRNVFLIYQWHAEPFKDTKWIISSRTSKTDKRKIAKEQPTIYKTLHRKQKIDQHEPR
jgi:hypothetical protein